MVISFTPSMTFANTLHRSSPSFGKQATEKPGQSGPPTGSPRPGRPSKLTPEMKKVLDHLKAQLMRRSPTGEIQQQDALQAVTTLINLQKGTQFAETDFTKMVGGLMGPMNPFRNDPQWLAKKARFQQQQAYQQPQAYPQAAAYRANPYAAYGQSYGNYGTQYPATPYSSYSTSQYPGSWGQSYTTNAYYPGNIRYY